MKAIPNPKPRPAGIRQMDARAKKLANITTKLAKLVGQKITAFGTQSHGYWGSHPQEISYKIKDINCDFADAYHSLNLYLHDYDADQYGLIYTDTTFLKSLRHLLKKFRIKAKIDYSEQGAQGDDFVNFDVCFE